MSERKARAQPLAFPEWAWWGLAGIVVPLGIVMITYSVAVERWASAAWYCLLTVGLGALFLRRRRRQRTATGPVHDSGGAAPAALSWDDPSLKRAAAIFVLVAVSIGLIGVAVVLRGTGLGPAPSEQGRWIYLIGGPILALLGFGSCARVIRRWRSREGQQGP